jgi:hypothetical protein
LSRSTNYGAHLRVASVLVGPRHPVSKHLQSKRVRTSRHSYCALRAGRQQEQCKQNTAIIQSAGACVVVVYTDTDVKQGQRTLSACLLPVILLACTSTLKKDAVYSSETSVTFYRTTWFHIPEDISLGKQYVSSWKAVRGRIEHLANPPSKMPIKFCQSGRHHISRRQSLLY